MALSELRDLATDLGQYLVLVHSPPELCQRPAGVVRRLEILNVRPLIEAVAEADPDDPEPVSLCQPQEWEELILMNEVRIQEMLADQQNSDPRRSDSPIDLLSPSRTGFD